MLQVVGDRDVEHRVDGVLAGPRRDLADGQVLERLRRRRVALEDPDVRDADGDDPRLVAAERARRRAGSASFAFRSAGVPRVASTHAGSSSKRFQSSNVKVKAAVGGDALPVDADAALPAGVEPRDERAVRLGVTDERLHHVVEDRPAAHLRQLLDVREVVPAVGRRERHLHEALVALGEHLGEAARAVASCMTSVTIGPPS